MVDNIKVAILGSTGYVGIELVKILSLHPNVVINFLGSENTYNKEISSFDSNLKKFEHPLIKSNQDFNPSISDVVFLALPHGISNKYVKNYINKKIIPISLEPKKVDLKNDNKHQFTSLENIARIERHNFLFDAASHFNANFVALGHHLDDQD